MSEKSMKEAIDKRLSSTLIDAKECNRQAEKIREILLGPTPEAESEKKDKAAPVGWLERINDLLESIQYFVVSSMDSQRAVLRRTSTSTDESAPGR